MNIQYAIAHSTPATVAIDSIETRVFVSTGKGYG